MNKRILSAYVAICLAVVGVWLVISGIAQAAAPPLDPHSAESRLVPGAVSTPTLRLVTPDGKALLSPPFYRMLVSERAVSLNVYNPLDSEVDVTAELVAFRSASGGSVPAALGLSPTSQVVTGTGVATFTLSLEEGWLPTGGYSGTLKLSAEGTETPNWEFVLLVSPWTAELEWVEEEALVYVAGAGHPTATVRFVARYGDAEGVWAELATLEARDGVTPTDPFTTASLLRISGVGTKLKDDLAELTLDFFNAEELPRPGTYDGVLRLGASNAAAITKPFTLVVPDRAPVSPWPAELAWVQEDFVFVAGAGCTHVHFEVRYADAEDVKAEVVTLAARGGTTAAFHTEDFLRLPDIGTKAKGERHAFGFNFGDAERLPVPGTYDGVLRLSARNAKPITTPFTLVIPDRARGSYTLEYAGAGQTPVTTSVTLGQALQFTGVRWLPGSNSVLGWWPRGVGALFLALGLAALVGYPAWALLEHGSAKQKWYDILFKLLPVGTFLAFGIAAAVIPVLFPSLVGVGERNLFVWEKKMRGPVRNVTVLAGEVANDLGETGQIYIDDPGRTRTKVEDIKAGDVLSVEVGVSNLSRPGVYKGHILIQSPDIKEGVKEVPVHVTVRDFMLWPALVILLGVVGGGCTKYLVDAVGERLGQRRELERAWEQWNAYLERDPYWYWEEGSRVNPLYTRIHARIEMAVDLLRLEPEWGVERARETANSVRGELERYKTLGAKLTRLKDEIGAADVGEERDKFRSERERARSLVPGLERDIRWLKDKIDELEPRIPPEQLEELKTGFSKLAKQFRKLQEADEGLALELPLELRDEAWSEISTLDKELRRGRFGDAEQRWSPAFEVRLPVELGMLRNQMSDWVRKYEVPQASLEKAQPHLSWVDSFLKQPTKSPELYAEAWRRLIQAQAVFEAEMAEMLADWAGELKDAAGKLKQAAGKLEQAIEKARLEGWGDLMEPIARLLDLERVFPLGVLEASGVRVGELSLERVELRERVRQEIRVKTPKPYLWSIEDGEPACTLALQVCGFQSKPRLDVDVEWVKLSVDQDAVQSDGVWEFGKVKFTLDEKWDGAPVRFKVIVGHDGEPPGRPVETSIEIRSPYIIELPFRKGDIVAGELLVCQAVFQGPDLEEAKKHRWFRWLLSDSPDLPGSPIWDPMTEPAWRCQVPSEAAGKPARIWLEVYAADDTTLLQKALLEGQVREPLIMDLYRDKRRQSFWRRAAALLLALVGGALAQRIFRLTFGSAEQYLGAFAWGVAAGAGVDPAAGGWASLKKVLQNLVPLPPAGE